MNRPWLIGAYPTPWVTIWAVVSPDDGTVRGSSMSSRDDAVAAAHPPAGVQPGQWLAVDDAVAAWVRGDHRPLMDVPAAQPGGPFFQAVWAAMRTITPGEPVSYGELAAMAGRPGAARAVGTACSTNALAPFVPCHRVVRSGGDVGHYGYGVDLKRTLLEHEAGQ